jgi:lipoprotein NlpI
LFDLARFSAAADALAIYAKANPTDGYAALWLYLARRRAGQDGAAGLDEEAKTLDLGKWPGPIIRYYQGAIPKEAALAAVPDPKAAKKRDCEAAFYIAEIDLIDGGTADAKARFQHALDVCHHDDSEFTGAEAELGRL